jgi:heme-degrading monooxygenase HmoA
MPMFAVIFEVEPRTGKAETYLQLAARLRPELERIEGFVDVERFASRDRRDRFLSLSVWRDEKALIRWRTQDRHHAAQEQGRAAIFADYRLRVGEIAADTRRPDGEGRPQRRFDETEKGVAKYVTIIELSSAVAKSVIDREIADPLGLPAKGTPGMVEREWFESIVNAGKLLLLVGWRDRAAAERCHLPQSVAGELHHRRVRIIRDYGMFDRAEAPQYYPPAPDTD